MNDYVKLEQRKPFGTWYVIFRVGQAKWKTRSLKTKDKAKAERLVEAAGLEKIAYAAMAGLLTEVALRSAALGAPQNLGEAGDEWIRNCTERGIRATTVRKYRVILTAFLKSTPGLTDGPICGFSEQPVGTYINAPDGSKYSTRITRRNALRVFSLWLANKGYIAGNPARLARINTGLLSMEQQTPKTKTLFTEDEVRKLLRFFRPNIGIGTWGNISLNDDGFWYYATLLAWQFGFRLYDMAALESASIGDDYIELRTKKTNRLVRRPITKELANELKLIARGRKFVWPYPAAHALSGDHGDAFCSVFSRCCNDLGMPGKSWRSLRRSVATRVFNESGGDIKRVQEELGHSSPETSRLYVVGPTAAPAASISPTPRTPDAHAPESEPTPHSAFELWRGERAVG
jgi:integrase